MRVEKECKERGKVGEVGSRDETKRRVGKKVVSIKYKYGCPTLEAGGMRPLSGDTRFVTYVTRPLGNVAFQPQCKKLRHGIARQVSHNPTPLHRAEPSVKDDGWCTSDVWYDVGTVLYDIRTQE
jgi:hypothetical protein